MKPILKIVSSILLIILLVHVSCKKEYSCENCINGNQPPIADAGPDQVITSPTDSISLNGSASKDPDGKISEWLWTKISGPASFNIVKPSESITKLKTLIVGTYQFELKVIDNGGLSAKDTVQVTVNDPAQPNRPPAARAGADQTITLPTNAINLDGSASTDPDNNITTYAWTKISGPSSFSIVNLTLSQTQIINLVQGTYQFELKVTDAGGLFSKDTVQATVITAISNNCIPSQTFIGSLSIPRGSVNILEASNKIVFAGGFSGLSGPPMYGASSRVDIYDKTSQSWSTAELSLTRFGMGTTVLNNKIYFAGGYNGNPCSRVDIYDALNNTWSITELSEARGGIIAVAAGNKVVFAGGFTSTGQSNKVDIYDQSNGNWSTATLSQPTSGSYNGKYEIDRSGVVSAGNKIYFMTGSNTIDIYDIQTNTWSVHIVSPDHLADFKAVLLGNKIYFSGSVQGNTINGYNYSNTLETYDIVNDNWSSISMFQSRSNMEAIAGDGKIFRAGGFDSSWLVNGEDAVRPVSNIEIYDINTGLHSFHNLQQSEWFVRALKTNSKIFFSYGNSTETYDMNTHSWTTCSFLLGNALAIGNTVYQVGSDSRVWKLEF